MIVRYTATAREETAEILARIAADNPGAAAAVSAAIKSALKHLRTFPRLGAQTNTPGVYLRIARPYHYLIFYSIAGDTVFVLHLRHPARLRASERL
jgi:plasmid stabilization system protein ParE